MSEREGDGFVSGVHHFCDTIEAMGKEHRAELAKLRAEIRRLRAALGWYVNCPAETLMMFGSDRAVDALSKGLPDVSD